jgi:hypothetical protein
MKNISRTIVLLVFTAFIASSHAFGQVSINTDGSEPDISAMLDVKSTTGGFLTPRMTLAQRDAIVTPATGLVVYQTDISPGLYVNSGTPADPLWNILGPNTSQWLYNGANIYYNSGKVGVGTADPLASFHVAKNSPGYTALFGTDILSYNGGTNVSFGDDAASTMLYIGQSTNNKGYITWNYNANPVDAQFMMGTYGGSNPLLLQPYSGNVGIGLLAPLSKLHVLISGCESLLGYTASIPNYFNHIEDPANGPGQSAIFAVRDRYAANNGYDYAYYASNSALKGLDYYGDEYGFGTSGFSFLLYTRSGGVLGAFMGGNYWGSLGYRASGWTTYGGYFSNWNSGGGKSSDASTGIGIGVWGDLMGADIHGKVYGVYTEGDRYAVYSNGIVFKNNLDVHLQENGTGKNTVLYTNVSTEVTVQTSGYATLTDGKASIDFDQAFVSSVSSATPIVVTVTPTGNSNGVYLSGVSGKGFKVAENNDGKSTVTVSYIAIGRRAGFEHPNLPAEVIESNYTQNLARGLHNDADTKTNGEGLYYENGRLTVGIHPSTLPDPKTPGNDKIIRKTVIPIMTPGENKNK